MRTKTYDILADVPDEATAVRMLTTDPETGEDTGWLACPGSRYGRTGADCAPVAWRIAEIIARETGEPIIWHTLEGAMSQVVNDHDDVAYLLANYGTAEEREEWAEHRDDDED